MNESETKLKKETASEWHLGGLPSAKNASLKAENPLSELTGLFSRPWNSQTILDQVSAPI